MKTSFPLVYQLVYKLVKKFQKDNPLEYQNLFLTDHDIKIDFRDRGENSKFYIGNNEYFLQNDQNFLILCHCTYTINWSMFPWPMIPNRIHFINKYYAHERYMINFINKYYSHERYMIKSSGTMDFVNEILVPLTGILYTEDMRDLSFEWLKQNF